MALSVAKFLKCRIDPITWFSRKTYFYPDLPKNFQITQYDSPLGVEGSFESSERKVRITRVHLEEDPGKIRRVGKSGEEVSLVDYNRSGIPLVEIVTEPDLRSPAEARDFMTDLLIELRYLVGISYGDEQTVRVDANISVGKERVEIKNILGLKNMERALKFEVVRQTRLLKAGKRVVRETRRFDEERKVTLSSRKKELEEDYGYIGEPDLGVFHVGSMVQEMELPETPLIRANRIARDYDIPLKIARQMILTSWTLADLFEGLCSGLEPQVVLPWVTGPISSRCQRLGDELKESLQEAIADIISGVNRGEITDVEGRIRLYSLLSGHDMEEIQETPTGLLETIARLVDEHPKIVEDYRQNEKAANFLIGQVMNATRGMFSSEEVVNAVRRELERRL